MTETLRRMKFAEADEALADSRTQLALDAQKQLGYSRLAQAIATPSALLFGLRKLGIEPLVTSSVEHYMQKKAGRPGMRSSRKSGITFLSLLALASLTLGPTFFQMANGGDGKIVTWVNVCGVIGCVLLVAADLVLGIISGIMINENDGERTQRVWKTTAIGIYDGSIPEFVLDRALRINTAVPGADFAITQLYVETDTVRRDPDPFLVVTLGYERYYVDVWDEKEYETRL